MRQTGFTLIEVLLAMSITAITAIMAYQAMDSAGRLSEVIQDEGDGLQKLSSAMSLMAQDFRHISIRKVRDPEGGKRLKLAFEFNEFSSPMLAFTRTGKVNPQVERFQRDHLERVNYHLEDEKLIRSSWSMTDHYDSDDAQHVVLFRDIQSFKLESIKLESNSVPEISNGTVVVGARQLKTYDKWPINDSEKTIPDGVKITLDSKRWGILTRTFELVGEL